MQKTVSPPDRLTVISYALTDRGQVRSKNEDQFLSAQLGPTLRIEQSSISQGLTLHGGERGHLFAIADGLGGHAGGAKASALAIHWLVHWVLDSPKLIEAGRGDLSAEFEDGLRQANERIGQEASKHPELKGMGTTLTLAYCWQGTMWVAHVGDSRAYLFRGGELQQLTRDHTVVQEMIKIGFLTRDEATHHLWRHIVTNVLGGPEPGVLPEISKYELQPNDRLLLCTDGLTDVVSAEEIKAVLEAEPAPRPACEKLIARANEKGAPDNVTVLLAGFTEPNG